MPDNNWLSYSAMRAFPSDDDDRLVASFLLSELDAGRGVDAALAALPGSIRALRPRLAASTVRRWLARCGRARRPGRPSAADAPRQVVCPACRASTAELREPSP
jgi:hypothetical protein